jgi:tRNA pseudouridine38-40 synthase
MLVEYDGADFSGWQVQPGVPSVQKAIEDALAVALREPVGLIGSGRTDAGVHARGQVAHFEHGDEVDLFRLRASLNGLLSRSVAVRAIERAPDGFHARYDARARFYSYRISSVPFALERTWRWLVRPAPDLEAMNRAASHLVGRHNFDAFCRIQSDTENRVCEVRRAEWLAEARPGEARFDISADRFLHGMVRAIVGTLLEIGQGKREEADIGEVMASGDRRKAGPAAPAHGLVLESVEYDVPFSAETFA